MFKQKLLKLQDKILQKVSEEIYARVVKPEAEKREKLQKELMANAIIQTANQALEANPKIYELGQVTSIELARQYTSYCGVDVRVFITEEPWELGDKTQKAYGCAQSISWTIDQFTGDVAGTLVDIVLDSPNWPEGNYITAVAMNEYGKGCVLFEGVDFRLITTSSGVSIDDLIIEQNHTFTCKYAGAYPLSFKEKFEDMPQKPTFGDWN